MPLGRDGNGMVKVMAMAMVKVIAMTETGGDEYVLCHLTIAFLWYF